MTGGADRNGARNARCVVWHERGVGLDPGLSATLAQLKGCHVIRCDSELTAFAQVCASYRAGYRTTFLLVEPARLKGLGEAVTLVARYIPKATIWRFEAGASRPLAAYEAPRPTPSGEAAPKPVRMKMPPGPPRLRLAGEGPAAASPQPAPEPKEPETPAPLLTDEELAMLLSPEDTRRRG